MIGIIYNLKTAYGLVNETDFYKDCKLLRYIYCVMLVVQISVSYVCFVLRDYTQFALIFYLAWISTIALVDYFTGYVYTKMKTAIYIPVAVCVILLLICDNGYVYIVEMTVSVVICTGILKFMEKTCVIGGGDVDVLIIGAVFISFVQIYNTVPGVCFIVHNVFECLITNMALFSLAGFLFAARYILSVNFKKMTLKADKPFVPSIYMAAVLYYILLF